MRHSTENEGEMSSTYPEGDPRRLLAQTAAGTFAPRAVRPASVFDLSLERPDDVLARGSRCWTVRGQNFTVCLIELVAGETVAAQGQTDEHFVVVSAGTVLITDTQDVTVEVAAPSVVIVPPGGCSVVAASDGRVLLISEADDDARLRTARNAGAYRTADPAVAPRGPRGRSHVPGLRVHAMDALDADPARLGRILRSSTLMVNWFPDAVAPRDGEKLSPHSHDDFEQCTITLSGTFVHHLRTTWTPRMSQWRPDEHVRVASPSITVIPPPLVHTTQGVEGDLFQLVDVFSPPRQDFLDQGWVLNADDYREAGTRP
jgi:mannose-6-phosphate isomerase-like protein (cupin superfamily)